MKKNIIKIPIILFIFSHSYAFLSDFKYYPQELIDLVDNSSEISSPQIKDKLFEVLDGIHIKNDNSQDEIVKECSDNQKCYSQRRDMSYKQARKYMFGDIYLRKTQSGSYYIVDKYCKKSYGKSAGVGPMRIPNHQLINCEHTWPQSRFSKRFSKSLQKNDLHHLYPVNSRSNSTRGNIIFGEVNGDVISKDCQSSSRGTIDYKNSTTKSFEPPVEHRGNIARALFYFSIRYKLSISDEEEFYLRRWHREDPVDNDERQANQKIFLIQKNRNPFIDQPSLVSQVGDF